MNDHTANPSAGRHPRSGTAPVPVIGGGAAGIRCAAVLATAGAAVTIVAPGRRPSAELPPLSKTVFAEPLSLAAHRTGLPSSEHAASDSSGPPTADRACLREGGDAGFVVGEVVEARRYAVDQPAPVVDGPPAREPGVRALPHGRVRSERDQHRQPGAQPVEGPDAGGEVGQTHVDVQAVDMMVDGEARGELGGADS